MKPKSKPTKIPAPVPAPVAARHLAHSMPTHEQIRVEAEAIWRLQGCPVGRDDANWLEAEHGLIHRGQLERDKRDQMALADPRFAFNADADDLMTELNGRFAGRTGQEPTAL